MGPLRPADPAPGADRLADPAPAPVRPAGVAPADQPGTGGSGSAAAFLGRRFLGCLGLSVLNLLEDLAHAWPHQVARLRVGISIATPCPGGLPRVEVVGGHPVAIS